MRTGSGTSSMGSPLGYAMKSVALLKSYRKEGGTMPTPRPGTPVRGSRTGQPMMAVLDLLGRRWALHILWELRHGAAGFRSLRARCDAMSPSVLNQRLRELRAAGVVTVEGATGYRLSE